MDAIAYAATALRVIEQLIAVGTAVAEVGAFVKRTNDALAAMQRDKRDPNTGEWSAMNATTLDLLEKLNRPR